MSSGNIIKSAMSLFERSYLLGAILAAGTGMVLPGKALAQGSGYTVADLSDMSDASQVLCRLNNRGDVAGRAIDPGPGEMRATIWNRGQLQPKHLKKLAGGEYSSALGISDLGEVVGAANTDRSLVPFLWTPAAGLERVPMLPGDSCGQAWGINKYRHVVGFSSGRSGKKAFFWTRRGGIRNLGTLPGGNYAKARDINDADEIAGTSASVAGDRAVLWTKYGNPRDLGALPGDTSSEALAINNSGDVVGYSKGARGMRAFLWTKESGMLDLGVLPGGDSSRALDVNDLREVVGGSTGSSGDRAFIWTKETGLRDLNSTAAATLDLLFVEAHSINYRGQILVTGDVRQQSSGDGGIIEDHKCAPAPGATFLLTPTSVR